MTVFTVTVYMQNHKNPMSQHYTNSMDEICVPVIKKILGHYLELNPNYNNGLQRHQQPNSKVHRGKK